MMPVQLLINSTHRFPIIFRISIFSVPKQIGWNIDFAEHIKTGIGIFFFNANWLILDELLGNRTFECGISELIFSLLLFRVSRNVLILARHVYRFIKA